MPNILSKISGLMKSIIDNYEGDGTYSAPFPHCDQRVLHGPGECTYCDHYPHYQELREAWGISFTGHSKEDLKIGEKLPCPAEMARPEETINQWSGNVAKKECNHE